MKIWGIADTHLAAHKINTMSNYGSIWMNHRDRIVENWHKTVNEEDSVLIGGDVTWAANLKYAMVDINLLESLPGKHKFIVKGNHDIWWKTLAEVETAMSPRLRPLSGTALMHNGHVVCGTMGWLSPNDPCFDGLDMKSFKAELKLLEEALEAAVKLNPQNGLHLLMHFPPFTTQGYETPFFRLINQYPVTTCTFGHFHIEKEWECLPQGNINGIEFRLIATDFLCHQPYLIWDG